MIVVVDERAAVTAGFVAQFGRVGVSAFGLDARECRSWVEHAAPTEIAAVEAFLVGECQERRRLTRAIRARCAAALIALRDGRSLADTLELFDAGCDDVVRKPVHVSELLARIKVIHRRATGLAPIGIGDGLRVYCDGRNAEVDGEPIVLPRRQRRILELLAAHPGVWMSKARIYNSVYGPFSEDVGETAIECHVSRLRKRVRERLGYDPICSQRYLGYCFDQRR